MQPHGDGTGSSIAGNTSCTGSASSSGCGRRGGGGGLCPAAARDDDNPSVNLAGRDLRIPAAASGGAGDA